MYIQADYGTGVKVALDHHGTPTTAETVNRETTDEDREKIFKEIRRFVPDLDGEVLDSAVCMYTNTADHHYLVGFHPEHPSVLIGSPCSGHGFKMASALGEEFADMLLDGRSRPDLSPFGIERLLT